MYYTYLYYKYVHLCRFVARDLFLSKWRTNSNYVEHELFTQMLKASYITRERTYMSTRHL